MSISLLFLFFAFKVTNILVLPTWPGVVVQEAHDHSYFRTQSVVNKVHPYYHSGIKHEQNNSISIQVKMTGNVGLA